MKTDKTLEQKLADARLRLPELGNVLDRYLHTTWGIHSNGGPIDVQVIETNDYILVGTRWHGHLWEESGGGIKWTDWATLYYRAKVGGKLKVNEGNHIVTRDQYDQRKDLRNLWPYNYISLRVLHENFIEVAWTNEKGDIVQVHELVLKG